MTLRAPPALALAALAILGCKGDDSKKERPEPAEADAAPAAAPADAAPTREVIELPPADPLPRRPAALPRPPRRGRKATPERVALGQRLFLDDRIWGGSRGCASCHDPDRGFSSAEALPETRAGKTNLRHTPSLWNALYQRAFYWDGRAETIESLIPGHVAGQLGAEVAEVAARLAEDRRWRAHFERSFDGVPSAERIAEALADFLRTRYSPVSPWDRHESGEVGAASAAAVRGSRVFNQRAGCAVCHPPPLYTDLGFHPTAVPAGVGPPDRGRARVTGADRDRRAFKTPSLRGLTMTAPYFHAGTAATLEDAISIELGRAYAGLTFAERADLVAFLESLSP